VQVEDLDGNRFYDLTGSYGVNLFGYDFYKTCIAEGAERGRARARCWAPTTRGAGQRGAAEGDLGAGRGELPHVRHGGGDAGGAPGALPHRPQPPGALCGAYHGWWEDVQPGPGNPLPPRETYTLADLSERSLKVLAQRRDVACVLVNPLQALHPNSAAPGDSSLVDGSRSRVSTAPPTPPGCSGCAGVQRARHRADL
jgi:glutamate-1-semialdehyde 2,1-aminomutase